ncbi:hypothetical protein OGAPHI_001073 [Ogataea philodendri]|uniref:Acyl carrier protein n=1 Tax=Ogataea philodendri TaxID=1378263 RepID=A0A9P8PE28_9ASCO|nr:uncharacterized protein OGAPHI_001073 [Ogataea philodendri]KAH3670558.1 hypothetical protein OGAPHI_001073 [Ogataea philodendri]
MLASIVSRRGSLAVLARTRQSCGWCMTGSRLAAVPVRFYSDSGSLTREQALQRITHMLESYNKIKPGTPLTEKTSLSRDLGLDSLDSVEIMMELEYEFSIQIPDQVQDAIKTIGQAVDYIVGQVGKQ